MTDAVLDIKQWGNNLGVRLPVAVARAAGLRANQRVRVVAEDGKVVITPHESARPSLADRLEAFDPTLHGGESMQTSRIGAERW